jgi:23S rRNA pseudouridine1911/1915/1917 synthase
MVLARTPQAASELSRQVRDGEFKKTYLAVVHGCPEEPCGRYTDLLCRSKEERKTYVAAAPSKDTRTAILDYVIAGRTAELTLVDITLRTGRTHQIRCQFSSRGMPLAGDRKYSTLQDGCDTALWSHTLRFAHPVTGEGMSFAAEPPRKYPWDLFEPMENGG